MNIPAWAKPLIAARERGATLQVKGAFDWIDEKDVYEGHFRWVEPELAYRIKPGTDPGERKVDPLIFGTVVPAFEPVPVRDEYVPLTDDEAWELWKAIDGTIVPDVVRDIYRAGWERRRTP